jgi:transposase
MPSVRVTAYRKHQYTCRQCHQVVEGQGGNELPGSYIGPVAKAVSVYLKYHIKVSDRDIRKLFQHFFGLTVTPSALPGFRNQLGKRFQPVYTALVKRLKRFAYLHTDETGWRLDGESQWLWNFSTRRVSVNHIDKSRGQQVVEDILGKKYQGILITDFLSAYNKIETKAKQRCLVHLRRELKRVWEALTDDPQVQTFCARVSTLIDQAESLAENRVKLSRTCFHRRRLHLEQSLQDMNWIDPSHRILQRFVKRFCRHRGELFTFVDYPGIPSDNNAAERQIRPNFLLRKLTFGNRSEKGIHNHNVLMSILQTAHLSHVEPLGALQKLLWIPNASQALKILMSPRTSPV